MLIQDGIQMPPTVVVQTERWLADWSHIIGSTSAQLGREIEKAGWTFSYMAGEIRTRAFGFIDQSRAARALGHLIHAVKLENCNCLEITQVRQRSFFGLPYTSVVAHARHIEKSRSFYDVSNQLAKIPLRSREWLSDHPGIVQSKSLIDDAPSEKVLQESVGTLNEQSSVSGNRVEPVDRIQAGNATNEPKFHVGENIILAKGPHKDVLGTFLRLEDEVEWAAIKEADGAVSCHPVAWMRNHRGLLSYTSLTGRQKT